jgi:VIT1/CCC1 family predicted Fe2+/Mn2+ transporter
VDKIIAGLLVMVGIIHLLPVSGVLGAERLSILYGIAFDEPNIEILMRHRAVLFGLLGAFLIYAAFNPAVQPLALVAGFVSVISFIAIAWSVGGYNESIRKVFFADIVAMIGLVIASVVYVINHHQS